MLVINLYGQPSAGKSTVRADVFRRLKQIGVNCEENVEYAKKLTWQKRNLSLQCQPYIFGKQLHELEVLRGQVDVVITDSPLLLSRYYAVRHNAPYPQSFLDCVEDVVAQQHTLNFFLKRVYPYSTSGRAQTEEQSDEVGVELQDMLDDLGVEYVTLNGDNKAAAFIVERILNVLGIKRKNIASSFMERLQFWKL
jgi:hypothetical protein